MRPTATDYSQKLCVHGLAVELSSTVTALHASLDHFLYPMAVEQFPDGLHRVSGSIRPYEESEVVKCLSPNARRVKHPTDPFLEMYQDGERFWVVDEAWGMVEINCLRRIWRSWILPRAELDVVRIFDAAVMWPMAQLLRPRGLHLVPAVSMVKDGWGVLMLTQHLPVEGEISRLIRSGYQVIGQRWTALRDEDGRIELLHLPGAVERPRLPKMRDGRAVSGPAESQWIDLTLEHPGSMHNYAFCELVLLIDARRAMVAERHELRTPDAVETLRQDWPIADIHPPKRWADLVTRVAQISRCVRVQLSYDPGDLSMMLSSLRATPREKERVHVSMFQRDPWGRPMANSSNAA